MTDNEFLNEFAASSAGENALGELPEENTAYMQTQGGEVSDNIAAEENNAISEAALSDDAPQNGVVSGDAEFPRFDEQPCEDGVAAFEEGDEELPPEEAEEELPEAEEELPEEEEVPEEEEGPEEEEVLEEEVPEEEVPEEEVSAAEHKKIVEELREKLAIPPRRKYLAMPDETPEFEDDECTVDIPNRSEMKENVQSVFKSLIKEGVKLGYLERYDGMTVSEIKEEYDASDYVYEFAEQELRKVALGICTVKKETKVGVYAFSWDGTDIHHIGYLAEEEKAEKLIPYIEDKDNYIFNICGVITGGKYKVVEKDAKGEKVKLTNCEALPYGIELLVEIFKKQG